MIKLPIQITYTAIAEFLALSSSVITGILSARCLGVTGRSDLAVAVLWPQLLGLFGELGLEDALSYYQAKKEFSTGQLVGLGLIVSLVESILLYGVGALLIPVLVKSHGNQVVDMGLFYLKTLPATLITYRMMGILRGQERMKEYNTFRVSLSIIYATGVVALYFANQLNVWNLVLTLSSATILIGFSALVVVVSRDCPQWMLDFSMIRVVFIYGFKSYAGDITNLFNQRLDQMLISIFLPATQLGLYVVSVSASSVALLSGTVFRILALPKIAGTNDLDAQKAWLAVYSRLGNLFTLISTLALLVILPYAIPLFYSSDFIPAILPAEILVIAAIFMGQARIWSSSFQGMGYPGIMAKSEMISLGVTIVCLVVLLPAFGILGAAFASLIAYLSSALYLLIQLRNKFSFRLIDLFGLAAFSKASFPKNK